MSSDRNEKLIARWTRLGVMFNVAPARHAPDLEQLLVETARGAPANARVFSLAANWLAKYGDYVAKQRLARMISEQLEPENQPVLGLLLESAIELDARHANRFQQAIDNCQPDDKPRPLFDVERLHIGLTRLAEQLASPLSRKWGRWARKVELKDDAIRPAAWVAEHNPSLAVRALLGGDLAASIIADCRGQARVFDSEVDLARQVGGSRVAVRDALRKLELAGLARRTRQGRTNRIEILPGIAA